MRSAPPHGLHLLDLAPWGLENGGEGEWPQRERPATKLLQVGYLAGWSPADVLQWLLSNPNGPSSKEQEQPLLLELRTAKNAKQAEVALLSTIYSRQQAGNPALQWAASELVLRESLGSESPDTAPYMEWLAIVSAGE
jgi:hypothetical protein